MLLSLALMHHGPTDLQAYIIGKGLVFRPR